MNAAQLSDPLMNALASLPVVEPDAAGSDAIRSRCRAALQAHGSQDPVRHLEPAAAGLACVYAWQVAKVALLLVR